MKQLEVAYDELENFVSGFAKHIQPNTTILLDGEVGAGKTTWTKRLFHSLGYNGIVSSPTFTLIKEYQGTKYHLVHVDAYRNINGGFIDLESYLDEPYVLCVEWSEYIEEELPEAYIRIKIDMVSEDIRKYTILINDNRYKEVEWQ